MVFSGHPAVSVIVPCYRVSDVVGEALDSLRAQTFQDFETIVVASNDPEDTAELERALLPYIHDVTLIKQTKKGLADARNLGILASRAPLIALLDGDDRWKPNYLEVQTDYLKRHPEVDVVYANAVLFGRTAWAGRTFRDLCPSRGEATLCNMLRATCRVMVAVTMRRQALVDVGMFDGDLLWAEDYDLWLRMTKAGHKIGYHDEILVEYRLRREGALTGDGLGNVNGVLGVLAKFLRRDDLAGEEREAALEAVRQYQANLDLILGRKALYRNSGKEAALHLTKANAVLKNPRMRMALILLRFAPWLLYRLVHSRYRTEYEFLH